MIGQIGKKKNDNNAMKEKEIERSMKAVAKEVLSLRF